MSETETVSIDILGLDAPSVQEAPPARPRDENGLFVAKDKPVHTGKGPTEREVFDKLVPEDTDRAAPVEAAPAETPKAAEPEVKPEEPKRTAAFDKAAKALILDGWTEEEVNAAKPERVIALGKAAKDRHSEVSRKLEASAQERKQEATAEVTPERRPAEPIRQPTTDFRELVKPIAASLAMDEESTSALADVFTKAVAAAVSQATEQVGQRQSFERDVDSVRQGLEERFPKLADDDEFQEVIDEASILSHGLQAMGRTMPLNELLERACKQRYFDDAPKATDTSKSDALHQKRVQGQPVSTSRVVTPRGLTKEQKHRRFFDALLDGEDADTAKRRILSG